MTSPFRFGSRSNNPTNLKCGQQPIPHSNITDLHNNSIRCDELPPKGNKWTGLYLQTQRVELHPSFGGLSDLRCSNTDPLPDPSISQISTDQRNATIPEGVGCQMMIVHKNQNCISTTRCNGQLVPHSMHCHLHRSSKLNWTQVNKLEEVTIQKQRADAKTQNKSIEANSKDVPPKGGIHPTDSTGNQCAPNVIPHTQKKFKPNLRGVRKHNTCCLPDETHFTDLDGRRIHIQNYALTQMTY